MNYKNRIPFIYSANSGSLVAAATATIQITFASDSDFILKEIRTSGNTLVTILISSVSGDNFCNNAFLSSVVGGANLGLKYNADGIMIPRGTQLKILFTNGDSSTHTEELQFWGIKVS